MSAYTDLRIETRPYAEQIVAAQPRPARFNSADIEHWIQLEQSFIASTAIINSMSVEAVVRRAFPALADPEQSQPMKMRA